jgi:hypothetical protein
MPDISILRLPRSLQAIPVGKGVHLTSERSFLSVSDTLGGTFRQ